MQPARQPGDAPPRDRDGEGPEAVLTPWGRGSGLRARRLRPGPGTPRKEVECNQRERLYGAMVASLAERGYERTRVGDLVALSGISSHSFYEHFADKRACFLATLEAMMQMGVAFATEHTAQPGSWEERARRGFEAFAEMIVAQPAGARMVLIDAYAAGPEAVALVQEQIAGFEVLTAAVLQQSPERAAMPPQMLRAFIGAMQEIARTRLHQDRQAEVPGLAVELWELTQGYRPPPRPLRAVRLRRHTEESLEGHNTAERVLRAFAAVVAERGYAAATVSDVVRRASISNSTFYEHFTGKEDALTAALDLGGAQIVAAVLPATRRAPEWASGIRAGFETLFSYLASRPALARLIAVEAYAAGAEAVEHRARSMRPLENLLAGGYQASPTTPTIATEAIAGGVYTLAYDQIRNQGPHSLPALAPLCTYIALAPFIGAEEACAVANGDGRRDERAEPAAEGKAVAGGSRL